MTLIARNLTELNDGFLRGKRYLILDRDAKYYRRPDYRKNSACHEIFFDAKPAKSRLQSTG
jgi:hypothetical protein